MPAGRRALLLLLIFFTVSILILFASLNNMGNNNTTQNTNLNKNLKEENNNNNNNNMEFSTNVERTNNSEKYQIYSESKQISFGDFLEHLKSNTNFTKFFIETLSNSRFSGYYFETPALTRNTLEKPFEFILMDGSSTFSRLKADPSSFSAYFNEKSVSSFKNIRGDATLVAPCPIDNIDIQTYTHLANFVRKAPEDQKIDYFRELSIQTTKFIAENPRVWMNTEGTGVYWLHFRLDSIPKYYHYQPYKNSS